MFKESIALIAASLLILAALPLRARAFVQGITDYQVFPRKGPAGAIPFTVKAKGPLTATVMENADRKTVLSRTWNLSAPAALSIEDVPVGGEYTLRFTRNNETAVFEHILVGEIWAVGGQSNAIGCEGVPVPPLPQVHFFQANWGEGAEPLWPFWYKQPHNAVNPWLSAAQTYYRLTGIPVGLMGAVNVSSINGFMDAQHDFVRFKDLLEKDGRGASVFCWYQGEADSSPEGSKTYQERLHQMAASLRRYADNPEMLIVIVQLSYLITLADTNPYSGRVREAQRAFCAQDPRALLVPALPYPHRDLIHLTAEAYKQLGLRIGEAVAETEKAGRPLWQGPRPVSARFADQARKRIAVSFDSAARLQIYAPAKRNPEDDWLITDDRHRGYPEAGAPEIKNGVITLHLTGARAAAAQLDENNQTVTIPLSDYGYLKPTRAAIHGLAIILDLPEPALPGASLSYALLSNATGSLLDENGKPAAAFDGIPIQEP
jgi:hypothetical protein